MSIATTGGSGAAGEFRELGAADGTTLAVRHWRPAGAEPRGTVVIVHGLGEHGGRYRHVAQHLTARGWAVTAHDHRGHGRSGGARGSLRHADDLVSDLAAVLDITRPRAGGPLILLGHSMGGVVAADLVAREIRPVDALVLSSPAFHAGLSMANRALLAVAQRVAANLPMGNGLDAQFLSQDAEVVRAYRDDPLVHDRVTARLVRYIIDAGVRARAAARHWKTPTLLLWSAGDRIVNAAGSEEFAKSAPPSVVRAERFDELHHEILNERATEKLYATLEEWLDERIM